jgi:hypothetical protein
VPPSSCVRVSIRELRKGAPGQQVRTMELMGSYGLVGSYIATGMGAHSRVTSGAGSAVSPRPSTVPACRGAGTDDRGRVRALRAGGLSMNREPMYWVRLLIYVLVAVILILIILFLLGVL